MKKELKIYTHAALVIVVGLFTVYLNQNFIYTPRLFYNTLSGEMSPAEIDLLLGRVTRLHWFGYPTFAILTLLKFLILATLFHTGFFLANIEVPYKTLLRCVIGAEAVFLASGLVKFIWFFYGHPTFTYDEVIRFSPLSLAQLTDEVTTDSLWIYPLQVLNLFEIGYAVLLAWHVSRQTAIEFDRVLEIIAKVYIPILFLWISLLVFTRVIVS